MVTADPGAAAELADVLLDAVADGTITATDARLIAESRIAGTRVEALADRHGLSTRTLWARRQRGRTPPHHPPGQLTPPREAVADRREAG